MLGFLLAFTSCEGFRMAYGQVLNPANHLPIDSVKCEVLTGAQIAFTDSNGRFRVQNPFGGCVPKCKDITIKLSKEGYKSLTLTNPADTVFFLEK